jgi:hypothetical protein
MATQLHEAKGGQRKAIKDFWYPTALFYRVVTGQEAEN